MRIDKRCETLYLLFQAFGAQYSFYVLGAGASAKIIPMTHELRNPIISRYRNFGLYSITPSIPDDVYYRIIGDPNDYGDPMMVALLRRLFPSAVHAMVLKELAPKRLTNLLYQYNVFGLARKPSTIFSMNVDGLARRYCSGHFVLEPHGGLVPLIVQILHSPLWDQHIDDVMEFGFDSIKISHVLLPKPEPKEITNRQEYKMALTLFPLARYLVLIGYSFGLSHNTMGDSETFEFFRELLRVYPKPVLVIGPHPGEVAGAIQEAIRQRTVYSIRAYWNYLSQAIIELVSSYRYRDISQLARLTSKILYRHDKLRDGFT